MNFLFVGIKWRQFLIIKLPFSFRMLYKQGWSFGAITDPFLSQVLSLSVLILTVSPVLRVSGSIAILAVEDLVCGLAEGRLVQIG